ncbi:MAG: hypothetical protein NZL89_04350, partial [Leptospiraceae bacterium]|nr:hypothetical protein [Leptospiraceae bacterium]
AWTGALTALLAAFIAAGQTDIKKVLAFSTVSQLGLMVAAVGCGSYAAAFFHLFTHAFFKAMLFLCAGAVITYLHHEQNIRHMGGLLREFPLLGFLFWIAIAALAGIPGFSGFFSKDHILAAAFSANFGGMFLGSILLVVSLLTAFYSFRLGIIVLHGKPAHAIGHGEELPRVSFYLPLVALAIPSLFAGFAALPALFTGNQPYFFEYLERNFPLYSSQLVIVLQHKHSHEQELMVVIAGVAAALVGAIAAIIYYGILKNQPVAEGAYRSLPARLALAKAYVDELYDFLFVQPYRRWAQRLASAEENLIPRIAEGVAGFAAQVARFIATLQTGVLAHYALSIFIGIVLLLALMLGVL